MPLYQKEAKDIITVDFGPDASLTLILRSEGASVGSARQLLQKQKQAGYNEKRIKLLERQLDQENLASSEFERITSEIELLSDRPDQLTLLSDFLTRVIEDWTDNFESREAQERGDKIPFNKENLELLGVNRLSKIAGAINDHFGYKADDTKESPAN